MSGGFVVPGGGDSSGGGGLVLRPAAQASKATAASGRDSPPPLSGGADAAGAPEATAVAPATDDATFRSINWSPAPISVFGAGGDGGSSTPIRSTGMDSSAATDRLSVSGAGIGIGFGMGMGFGVGNRTPGRVSPLEGVRGAALSAESSMLGGGGGWSRRGAAAIGRTGSLSPGDDT